MSGRIERAAFPLVLAVAILCSTVACDSGTASKQAFSPHGEVYYCDGAGGGGLMDWGRGVKTGLQKAGYKGAYEDFPWETGMGVVADQDSSVEFKRSKAKKLAGIIRAAKAKQPDAPVTLMGLSAGTTVAVFTLEELPKTCPVDNVILLGCSTSHDYNLTEALKRVQGRMYVFTSTRDSVLNYLVPMAGTADRRPGDDPSAGLRGFDLPAGASIETRRLYAKITNIAWRPEFEKEGDYGGHTDTTNELFVRDHIAPIVMQDGPHHVSADRPPSKRN